MDEHKLKSIPLFATLGKRELRQVAQAADEIDVAEGKELLREGQFAYEFMVIHEGRAEVTRDMRQLAASIPDLGQTLRATASERHPLTQS